FSSASFTLGGLRPGPAWPLGTGYDPGVSDTPRPTHEERMEKAKGQYVFLGDYCGRVEQVDGVNGGGTCPQGGYTPMGEAASSVGLTLTTTGAKACCAPTPAATSSR